MPDDTAELLHRLIGGDPSAAAEIAARAPTTRVPALLVAAALLTPDPGLLTRAAAYAVTSRDRQLVAIAGAHVAGDEELLDALVRDHLADFPDNILAAWIAAKHTRPNRPAPHQHEGASNVVPE